MNMEDVLPLLFGFGTIWLIIILLILAECFCG